MSHSPVLMWRGKLEEAFVPIALCSPSPSPAAITLNTSRPHDQTDSPAPRQGSTHTQRNAAHTLHHTNLPDFDSGLDADPLFLETVISGRRKGE